MSCLLTGEISQIWADNMGGSIFAFADLSLPLFTFAFAFVFIFAFVFVFMVVFIFAFSILHFAHLPFSLSSLLSSSSSPAAGRQRWKPTNGPVIGNYLIIMVIILSTMID